MSNTSIDAPSTQPPARRYEVKRTVIALTVTALAAGGAGIASTQQPLAGVLVFEGVVTQQSYASAPVQLR